MKMRVWPCLSKLILFLEFYILSKAYYFSKYESIKKFYLPIKKLCKISFHKNKINYDKLAFCFKLIT